MCVCVCVYVYACVNKSIIFRLQVTPPSRDHVLQLAARFDMCTHTCIYVCMYVFIYIYVSMNIYTWKLIDSFLFVFCFSGDAPLA